MKNAFAITKPTQYCFPFHLTKQLRKPTQISMVMLRTFDKHLVIKYLREHENESSNMNMQKENEHVHRKEKK